MDNQEQRPTETFDVAKLFGGGNTDVPESIVRCPECGGRLWVECTEWIDETGHPTRDGLSVNCYQEDAAVDKSLKSKNDWPPIRQSTHRNWQSDWQPVIDQLVNKIGAVET